ncbi:MAG: acetyl-CoA carboxylase biotin carboxylase subunit [Planctomycetota bacterium]|jgi:3-methylcrotonyl-CoA carboxylase alpha subunit
MQTPFSRVLIANRGEIAVRVARSLREMGIEAVAVYSDVDRGAAHCDAADLAVGIGGASAAESYLDGEAILAAARNSGAQAIHPGYGFLSENAGFARAVEQAGLCFIGPSAESMEILGAKMSARAAAEKAGVPVVPGWNEDSGDDEELLERAREVGFPLMVKASAGGGGKGMRQVHDESSFLADLAAGRREAQAAFGDASMLLEKVIHPARHVEIQILGDNSGKVVSLHERECSVQRRHQKVLEEAPSPAVDSELRARMGAAAVKLAESIGYRNAGTVEFLLDAEGEFYFLEVNTRLQVEHPVTELVLGLDLVQLQVALAGGEAVDELLAGKDLTPRGHAIEARIYAEQPERGFLPAAGILSEVIEARGPGVRVDSGVRSGDEVSVHYDPMLAKLIVHAPDRLSACRRMALALRDSAYLGIPGNLDFLLKIVESEGFQKGELRTDFVDLHPELLAGPGEPPPEVLMAVALLGSVPRNVSGGASKEAPPDTWREVGPIRLWPGGSK